MISIIAAVARNRAIGLHNKLLYWLPNDLKRFKALTTGHTIIMGRPRVRCPTAATWCSLAQQKNFRDAKCFRRSMKR